MNKPKKVSTLTISEAQKLVKHYAKNQNLVAKLKQLRKEDEAIEAQQIAEHARTKTLK